MDKSGVEAKKVLNNRLNIAVLFGGCSPEYSVSLQSAHAVLSHMDRAKYNPIPVGLSPQGEWFRFLGDVSRIAADTWLSPIAGDCLPALISPNRNRPALLCFSQGRVEETRLDAVFPVLHGCNGEDGTVQGLCQLAGLPLVGCGLLASALCMDKDRAHQLARLAGLRTPDSFVLHGIGTGDRPQPAALLTQAQAGAERLGYPLFIKPLRAGSSLGVSRINSPQELVAGLELAFSYDSSVIVEEAVSGFEVGCAVLGNEELILGEPDEIELSQGFFDFTEKYTLKTSAIHVPARISPQQTRRVKQAAQTVYRALGCRGFARVDFFLSSQGELVFNEVNTIPGFTAHSRFPNMLKAAGLSFAQVVDKAIALAVQG